MTGKQFIDNLGHTAYNISNDCTVMTPFGEKWNKCKYYLGGKPDDITITLSILKKD